MVLDMSLDIYNTVVEVIGTLPDTLNWVYGFATLFLLIIIFMIPISLFYLVFKMVSR